MVAELVRGQNHPLSQVRLEIRVSAGTPVVAGCHARRRAAAGSTASSGWPTRARPRCPAWRSPGRRPPTTASRWTWTPCRRPCTGSTSCSRCPPAPAGPVSFGSRRGSLRRGHRRSTAPRSPATPSPAWTRSRRSSRWSCTARQGAWKVRAVGQGYAGGLAELLTDQGLPQARQLAAAIDDAVAQGLARSIPAPGPRTADGERSRQAAASALGPDRAARRTASSRAARHRAVTVRSARTGRSRTRRAPQGRTAVRRVPRRWIRTPPGRRRRRPPVDRSTTATRVGRTRRRPRPRPTAPPAQPGQPAPPVAGDATGWSMEERLYNQVWGMFEDLARSTAAYRSAVDFADVAVGEGARPGPVRPAQPDRRTGRRGPRGGADQARSSSSTRPARRSTGTSPSSPPRPRWSSPRCRRRSRAGTTPCGTPTGRPMEMPDGPAARRPPPARRATELRIPMLVRLPLERGLWIDSGRRGLVRRGDGRLRTSCDASRWTSAVAHAARLLAVHPADEFAVHVIDPAGSGARALAPLVQTRGARGPARSGRGRRGGGPGAAHRAGRPGADGGARRGGRLAAARLSTPPSSC